jgi:hypothetical protein
MDQGRRANLSRDNYDDKAEGIPPIWISPEQSSFMQILLNAVRAKEIIAIEPALQSIIVPISDELRFGFKP